MKSFIKCPHCSFKLTVEMKAAITKGLCPACDKEIKVTEALGVLEFIDFSVAEGMLLSADNFQTYIVSYFKGRLGMEIPTIILEEEASDKARLAPLRAPVAEVDELPADDLGPNPNVLKKATPLKLAKGVSLTAEEVAEVNKGLGVMPISMAGSPNKVDSQMSATHEGDKTIKFIALTKEQKKAIMGGLGKPAMAPIEVVQDAPIDDPDLTSSAPEDTLLTGIDRPVRLIAGMPKMSNAGKVNTTFGDPDVVLTPKSVLRRSTV